MNLVKIIIKICYHILILDQHDSARNVAYICTAILSDKESLPRVTRLIFPAARQY